MSASDDAATASAALVQLRRRVDEHFAAAVARTPEGFACKEGCSKCCHARLTVHRVEGDRIADALARLGLRDPALRRQVLAQGRDPALPHCALLVDDRCVVYDERPVLCRSHGLPLLVSDGDAKVEVDGCDLNFVGVPVPPRTRLALDALNQPLSVIARMWQPDGERVALATLAAAD